MKIDALSFALGFLAGMVATMILSLLLIDHGRFAKEFYEQLRKTHHFMIR